MKPTQTISKDAARKALYKGVNLIYDLVKVTFGPQSKKALLYRTMNRGNRIVDDGYIIAECQEPKNPFVRMVAQTFREGCKRTVEKVGDGTTCTTILSGKLFNDVFKQTDETQNVLTSNTKKGVMTIRKEIIDGAEQIKQEIKKISKKVETLEDLEKIATVSVEDSELGKIIAKMVWDIGEDGFVDVVEGYKGEIETETIKGMRFPAKIPAKVFVNNPARYEMVVENAPILICNYKLDTLGDLMALSADNLKTAKLVVVAPSFTENVLVNFINAHKQGYFIYPVKAPSLRTEQLEDLAIYCGATFIDKNQGKKLQNVKAEDLGFIEKIIVKDTENKEDAVITGGQGTKLNKIPFRGSVGFEEPLEKTKVEERLEILKKQLEETKEEMFKMLIKRRIASMASAVGVIRVGDSTQANALYRKLKVEDAVFAALSALKNGYVKGGGLCLKEISDALPENHIWKKALLAPYEQIQGSVDGGMEIKEDIIDPTDVVFYATEHASQIVANLITVDSITCEIDDPMPEEGNFAIAKMLEEYVLTQKIKEGQIKEGEKESWRDSLGGMNSYEYQITHESGIDS